MCIPSFVEIYEYLGVAVFAGKPRSAKSCCKLADSTLFLHNIFLINFPQTKVLPRMDTSVVNAHVKFQCYILVLACFTNFKRELFRTTSSID